MTKLALIVSVLVSAVFTLSGCEGDAGPAGPAGPPGPSTILGFASLNGDPTTPTVYSFDGGATTGVAITRLGAGNYDVTFTGTYTGVVDRSDITVLATISDTANYHVASASMDQGSADATTIVVRVFVWSTSATPNPLADEDFSVVVLH